MKKRTILIALQIALIVSMAALLFTAALRNPLVLWIHFGIIAVLAVAYFHLGRCPHCSKHIRHSFLLRESTYCHNCGELVEFE